MSDGHVLLGGVYYPVNVLKADGVPEGCSLLQLLEDVGDRDTLTGDLATTFFAANSTLYGRRVGEHPTTGLPAFELVNPWTMEPQAR